MCVSVLCVCVARLVAVYTLCVCVCVFVARLVALYTLRGYVCVSVSLDW